MQKNEELRNVSIIIMHQDDLLQWKHSVPLHQLQNWIFLFRKKEENRKKKILVGS